MTIMFPSEGHYKTPANDMLRYDFTIYHIHSICYIIANLSVRLSLQVLTFDSDIGTHRRKRRRDQISNLKPRYQQLGHLNTGST